MSTTVDFIKKLREANFTEAQAEAIASIIEVQEREQAKFEKELVLLKGKELATKHDLKELELTMKSDIRLLELRLIKWLAGFTFGAIVTLGGMIAKGFHWW
ncbi:MAG: hypothetical protein ACK5Z5_09045 [Neisseriaceae bacterium]|jgi:hypothetical protein